MKVSMMWVNSEEALYFDNINGVVEVKGYVAKFNRRTSFSDGTEANHYYVWRVVITVDGLSPSEMFPGGDYKNKKRCGRCNEKIYCIG